MSPRRRKKPEPVEDDPGINVQALLESLDVEGAPAPEPEERDIVSELLERYGIRILEPNPFEK